MSLEEKITAELKDAMRAKDKEKLNALRAIKSAILLAKTQKVGTELDEKAEMALLQKLQKQLKDSADIYNQQGRPELAAEEEAQLAVIESFLPKQMSDEELTEVLQGIIKEVGAASPADMGKVMGKANAAIAGRASGKAISEKVKVLLGG